MILGMTPLTFIHVLLSLIGIGAGFVVLYGLLTRKRVERWTTIFLATTVATSVTGFFFPFERFLPSHAFGILSLLILPLAYYARYGHQLTGHWRWVYIVSAMTTLYLNLFVLIVQAFLKVPALKELAPTQSEPPFFAAQGLNFLLFVGLTSLAVIRFRTEPKNTISNAGVIKTA